VGRDGRSRPLILPMTTTTGRNTWSSAEFIFALPSYLRGLIQPPPGRALAYLDYRSQEILVAGALSGDEALLAAYATGGVYLALEKHAKLISDDATEESHKDERKWLKSCVRGMQYEINKLGLSRQLDMQTDYGAELIEAHRRTYPRFLRWKQAVVDRAL